MSFSKAKIQRFNEKGSEAPPPGAYDPKFECKVKGHILEKSERFPDNKSVCSTSVCSHVSKSFKATSANIKKVRNSQTPQKKRVIVKPQSLSYFRRSGKSPNVRSKVQKGHYDVQDELLDLKVECANKNKTIEEYEEQIQKMNSELENVKQLLAEHRQKDLDIENQHKRDIESMAKLQQEVLDSREEKYRAEIELLRLQMNDVSLSKERELSVEHNAANEWKMKALNLESELLTMREEIRMLEDSEAASKRKLYEMTEERQVISHFIQLHTEMDADLSDAKRIEVKRIEEEQKKLQRRIKELETHLELEKKRDKEISSVQSEIVSKLKHFMTLHLELKCKCIALRGEQQDALENFKQEIENIGDEFVEELETIANEYLQEKEELEQRLEIESANKEELQTEIENNKKYCIEIKEKLTSCQAMLDELNQKHMVELNELQTEIDKLKKEHIEEKVKLQDEISKYKEDNEKLEQMYILREEELAEVKKSMTKKIEEVKKHADKMVKNAEAVTRETLAACRNESEEKVRKIIAETDSKVNVMVQEARNVVNEEMRSTADRYVACLERVEADRSVLDDKLAQRDAEISWLSAALEELKTTAETQESFSQSLQAELDRVEAELVERKEELRALKDQIRSESAEMVARKRRFEVIMTENQASVNALIQRLAESDAQVERLQRELKSGEHYIQEHTELISAMHNSSKLMNEQMYTLMNQLDSKRSLIDQLESNNLADIESMRLLFDAKIDNLKQMTAKEISRLQEECEKKDNLNIELKQQLDNMSSKLKEAQSLLLQLEENNDQHSTEIAQLEVIQAKLKQSLKEKDETIDSNRALYEAQAVQYQNKISQIYQKINTLKKRVDEVDEYKMQVQAQYDEFEREKLNWEKKETELKANLEQEIKAKLKVEARVKILSESCERFQKEYQELSEKYSEILGHHNPKQRVKHIEQLKEKIYTQQVEMLRLKQELESKTKLIDHLSKSGEKRMYSKGKENVQSNVVPRTNQGSSRSTLKKSASNFNQTSTPHTKSSNTTVVSSSSPHTPLRNRNE